MKIFLLVLISFLTVRPACCQNPFENPVDYQNYILNEQDKLLKKIIEYNNYIAFNNNPEENNEKRLDILYQINFSQERINALEPYKGDARLKESSIDILKEYKEAYDIKFNEVNGLRQDRETSFEAMQKYTLALDEAENKIKNAGEKFYNAQIEFAKRNKIVLKTSETYQQLEDQWKLNKHIRQVFLEFYRVYKADELFMNAMNNQNTEEMENKRLEIINGTQLFYKNLPAVEKFQNDTLFIHKAKEVVNYTKAIAGKEYQELVLLLKKGESMTNEDINRFNEIATRVNSQSQTLLTEFNKEKREIIKRHTTLEYGE